MEKKQLNPAAFLGIEILSPLEKKMIKGGYKDLELQQQQQQQQQQQTTSPQTPQTPQTPTTILV